MILVDTSIWIDYLRQGEPLLVEQLNQQQILMHGMVLGELAIGKFKIASFYSIDGRLYPSFSLQLMFKFYSF